MNRRLLELEDLSQAEKVSVEVDGRPLEAVRNETVLAALLAQGHIGICKTDRGQVYGPLCSMGVCYGCSVQIDGLGRQRACQIRVRPGMKIETRNPLWDGTAQENPTLTAVSQEDRNSS